MLQREEDGAGDHHRRGRSDVTVGTGHERGDPDEQRDARRDRADGGVAPEREVVGECSHDPHRDRGEQHCARMGRHRSGLIAQDAESVVETVGELVERAAGRNSEPGARRREHPDREHCQPERPRAHGHRDRTSACQESDEVGDDRGAENGREPSVTREDSGEPRRDGRAQRDKRDGGEDVSA